MLVITVSSSVASMTSAISLTTSHRELSSVVTSFHSRNEIGELLVWYSPRVLQYFEMMVLCGELQHYSLSREKHKSCFTFNRQRRFPNISILWNPRLWNHLPTKLKSCHSITRFKSLLKTHLMSQLLKDDVYL